MACRNAKLPMDKELPKQDRNTCTTREDQCKVTTKIYTLPMMRPKSMGAPLHLQRKLKPYQLNPKWIRDEEGRYRPKICCRFCDVEGHVKEDCQKFKALKDREKSMLLQKTKARAATNQRNKEEKEVSKSTHATKAHIKRSKKKTPCKQT